ncbi:uncharacterized protein LOC130625922 [Hydractinia symbiolongicarpus]|uniref:uncharacterized protein LOC130625922 n=1 Tax=Hydractinia symbiolongicarpus TaxID=13093 RepID=UPI00254B712B|nr:uncharacterized protein LOC130625922 [Hydractinia symbiolongicarpus]
MDSYSLSRYTSFFFALLLSTGYAQIDKQLGIKRTSNGKAALFRKIVANRKLNITPITGYSNCSFKDCGKYCVYNIQCESFNFKKATKTCELLSVDRNSKLDNTTFINATGWVYYDTGFNIRHPNWRNKYLYNISCPVNKCDKCTCLQPPEEKTHQCDCYSKEGVIKLAAGNWCWYAPGSCSVDDGEKIVIKQCDQKDVGQQFVYDGQSGNIFHKCSQKRVCPINNIVVLKESCSKSWYITDKYALSSPYRCPYPVGGLLETDNGLDLVVDICLAEKGIHRFQTGIDGRIQVKMFTGVSSLDSLTSNYNFPNNPSYGIAWFNQFRAVSYYHEANYFGRQFQTIFVPPTTGTYIFYMEVNDQGKLYITHPNSSPELLITITGYTTSVRKTSPQFLNAFERYDIEVLFYDEISTDKLIVGVEFPNGDVEYPLTEKYLLPPN